MGTQIYFDHDFSPELQKRRALVRDAVKQLNLKNIRAKCVFPAKQRLFKDGGEKTFSSLMDALLTLQELGIQVRVDQTECMEAELSRCRWSAEGTRAGMTLSIAEMKNVFMEH